MGRARREGEAHAHAPDRGPSGAIEKAKIRRRPEDQRPQREILLGRRNARSRGETGWRKPHQVRARGGLPVVIRRARISSTTHAHDAESPESTGAELLSDAWSRFEQEVRRSAEQRSLRRWLRIDDVSSLPGVATSLGILPALLEGAVHHHRASPTPGPAPRSGRHGVRSPGTVTRQPPAVGVWPRTPQIYGRVAAP